jgi:hypothetical protein
MQKSVVIASNASHPQVLAKKVVNDSDWLLNAHCSLLNPSWLRYPVN